LFAPVRQAFGDHLIFAAALLGYLGVAGVGGVASNTWPQLLVWPILAAVPFFAVRPLRRFRGVFGAVLVGALVLAVGGELLFRARYFGTDALLHFTGYSPLPVTALPGMVSPSDDPEIGYVFTPGAAVVLNGKRWTINDSGFRDGDFSVDKAPGRYRILVFGDSFVLGAGVAREERFSDQLEAMLDAGGGRVEVYNLGLAGVGLLQLAHLVETYGPRYRADLVLVGLRASQIHQAERNANVAREFARQEKPVAETFSFPRRYSFVLNIAREPVRAGLSRALSLLPLRSGSSAVAAPRDDGPTPFERLVQRCADYTRRHRTPVALVALRKMEFASDSGLRDVLADRALGGDASRRADHEVIRSVTDRFGVPFIDTYDAFGADARRSDYIVFPGDGHPNAAGHRLYAKAIASWLREQGDLTGERD
jgi:lysophospholipase L1-like esterase